MVDSIVDLSNLKISKEDLDWLVENINLVKEVMAELRSKKEEKNSPEILYRPKLKQLLTSTLNFLKNIQNPCSCGFINCIACKRFYKNTDKRFNLIERIEKVLIN
jgi:hypothetical protein